jgi:hypothetical protein
MAFDVAIHGPRWITEQTGSESMTALFLGIDTRWNTSIVSRIARSAVEARWDRTHMHTPSHFGFMGSFDDYLLADDHAAEVRRAGMNAERRKVWAKDWNQGPCDRVTEGCADSSGTCVWHPITCVD